jgi:uncharacterized protein YbjT (DUF2867 family)
MNGNGTILVAGGTGQLGRDVVGRLVARGFAVRVLTRDVEHGRAALGTLADQVELIAGDVRNRTSLGAAVVGVGTVVAAVQGFGGREPGGIRAVDRNGNHNLIDAAATAHVERYVLMSIHGASSSDSLALSRAKASIEAALRATAMIPIIVRPTAFMETWAGIIGEPILATGRARVFGRGRNPINFVAAEDVAAIVEEAVVHDDDSGRSIEAIGPENLSFDAIIERFANALGRPVPETHIPLLMLRAMAVTLRPLKPVLADQIAAAVVLDTTDRTAPVTGSSTDTVRVGATTFDAVIRAMVASDRNVTAIRGASFTRG